MGVPVSLDCEICGISFKPLKYNSKYCSGACKLEGQVAEKKVANRSKFAYPQKANDRRRLQAMLGRLVAQERLYEDLRALRPDLPAGLFDDVKEGVQHALETLR